MIKDQLKKYDLKINEFIKHNKLYYDESSPIISDRKFDDLKKK